MPSPNRATLIATTHRFLTAYNTLTPTRNLSLPAILAPRSTNCIHAILPSSLNRASMTNEQYAAYFTPLLPWLRNWRLEYDKEAKDWVVDEGARKVVVKARSWALICSPDEGTSDFAGTGGKGGLNKGEEETYQNEYVLFITMTESGEEVERVEEWVDSQASLEGMGKLRRRVAQEQKQSGETRGESEGGEEKDTAKGRL